MVRWSRAWCGSPVSKKLGLLDVITSFSPKKAETPLPALADGLVSSCAIAMPLPPAADRESDPFEKLTVAEAPKLEFRALAKLPIVLPVAETAPAEVVRVPASKSTVTLSIVRPVESTTAKTEDPVKPRESLA